MRGITVAAIVAAIVTAGSGTAQASHRHVAHRDGDNVRFTDTDSHGVLINTTMPRCSDDLGRPCVVYVTQDGMPGNSYWIDAADDRHWFWSENPVAGHRPPNHWLDEYGDALIDGMQASHPGQAGRNWHRCWFELAPAQPSYANCPDGSSWLM